MAQMPNPIYSVTKAEMVEFLGKLLREKAAEETRTGVYDNSGIIIAAMQELLTEFDDTDDVMAMLGKLPWVD